MENNVEKKTGRKQDAKKINNLVEAVQKSVFWVRLGLILFLLLFCFFIINLIPPIAEFIIYDKAVILDFWTKFTLPLVAAVTFAIGFSLTIRRTKAIEEQAKATTEATIQMKENQRNQMLQFEKELEYKYKDLEYRYKDLEYRNATINLNGYYSLIEKLRSENLVEQETGARGLYKIAQSNKEKQENLSQNEEIFMLLCSFIKSYFAKDGKDPKCYDRDWKSKKQYKSPAVFRVVMEYLFSPAIENPFRNRDFQADLTCCNLQCIELKGLYFSNVNFGFSAMHGAQMYSEKNGPTTVFDNCKFHDTYLQAANMANSKFVNCDFSNAQMIWTNMWGCDVENCNFVDADMTCAQLSESKFCRSNFMNAILDGADIYVAKSEKQGFHSIMRPYYDKSGNCMEEEKNILVGTSLCFAFIYPHIEFFYNGIKNQCSVFVNNIDIRGIDNNQSIKLNSVDRMARILNYLKMETVKEAMLLPEINGVVSEIKNLNEQKKILKKIARKMIPYAYPFNSEGLTESKIEKLTKEILRILNPAKTNVRQQDNDDSTME